MSSKKKAIDAIYPKRVCYFCGRSESDLKDMSKVFAWKDEISEKFDKDIEEVNKELIETKKGYQNKYKDFLKDTEGIDLDFTVKTVRMGYEDFEKKIPHLDQFLELGHGQEKLSDIRQRVKEIDFRDVDDLKERIDELRNEKEALIQSSQFRLLEKEFRFFPKYHSSHHRILSFDEVNYEHELKYRIFVCDLCSKMFEQASNAAWEKLHEYDD